MGMRYATLCSGIDGFGVGFDRAGMECVFQCEADKSCLQILHRHWPTIPKTEDVYDERTKSELIRLRPQLIAFGSPCQDLSVAGRRDGLSGKRSSVFFRCVELCFACEAERVVWENVPGVFSSQAGEDFATVLEAFTGFRPSVPSEGWGTTGVCIGPLYSVAWSVLDSQWFGLAQRRLRVFLVADFARRSRPYQILSLAESLPWDPAPSRISSKDVAARIARGADSGGRGGYAGRRREDDLNLAVCGTLNANGKAAGSATQQDAESGMLIANALTAHHGRNDPTEESFIACTLPASQGGASSGMHPVIPFDTTQITSSANYSTPQAGDPCHPLAAGAHAPAIAHTLRAEGHDASEDGTGRGVPLGPVEAYQCHGSNVGPMGVLRSGNGNETGGVPFTVAFQTRIARNGRGQPKDITDALTSSESGPHGDSKPHVASMSGVRRLTPVECARLQGFDDNWLDGLSDSAAYRCLGNAVSVPVVEWIAKRIMESQR